MIHFWMCIIWKMKEEFSYVPWSSYYKWFNTGNGHPSHERESCPRHWWHK